MDIYWMTPTIFFFLLTAVYCTVDLNIHQMQMVADHLTNEDCRNLINALHQSSFELEQLSDTQSNSDTPCIGMLLSYDRTNGFGKSFDDLALRLGQIGRRDLSEKLSNMVYEEKAGELDAFFLDDPFKKLMTRESMLLEQPNMRHRMNKIIQPPKTGRNFSGWEIVIIVFASLTLTVFFLYILYCLLGDAIRRLCRTYAPGFINVWVDMVSGEFKWFCKQTTKLYKRDVIGSKADNSSKYRQGLVDLNRNLNCYLHHGSLDAENYFDELIQRYQRNK